LWKAIIHYHAAHRNNFEYHGRVRSNRGRGRMVSRCTALGSSIVSLVSFAKYCIHPFSIDVQLTSTR
jgi:hypothetical protein